MQPGVAQGAEHRRAQPAEHPRERRGDLEWLHGVVERRASEEREGPRRRFGEPGFGRREGGRLRRRIVQERRDLGPGVRIDRRVVDLGEDRKTVLRQIEKSIQPLDEVQLPERACHVERARMDARRLDAELPPVARLRQRHVAHVVFEVEALVLDPVGMVELERDAQQSLTEDRREMQTALDVLQQSREVDLAVGGRRRIVDRDQGEIGVGVSVVRIDELCVLAAQLPHLLRAPRPCRSAAQSSRKIRPEPNSARETRSGPHFPPPCVRRKWLRAIFHGAFFRAGGPGGSRRFGGRRGPCACRRASARSRSPCAGSSRAPPGG